MAFQLVIVSVLVALAQAKNATRCRNVPGSPHFPTAAQWATLNQSVSGHLVEVVPSAKFCQSLPGGSCTNEQWVSSQFREDIPGAMNQVNWEQDYDSSPPSLCLRNSTTCGQGDVPVYGILAQSVSDVQAGVLFAQANDLRLAVKASGHDYLGRSTAKGSLLISTHLFQDITFHDSFKVGDQNLGSAVTVGSGVGLAQIYQASKAQGKIIVGGTASTVCPAGGYFQGAGHSALSPIFGLVVDNTLEINVVTADGVHRRVNSQENPDLFWAMRGGGAGSWGVVTSATFRTYPNFNATASQIFVTAPNVDTMANVAAYHAKHIFELGTAGQYYYVTPIGNGAFVMNVLTVFPNTTSTEEPQQILQKFVDGWTAVGGNVTVASLTNAVINDIVTQPDDNVGVNMVLGSRLMPTKVYETNPDAIGPMYAKILKAGGPTANLLGNLVAGGKVSANADIPSALNPKWREAKTHLITANLWADSNTIDEIQAIKRNFKNNQLPALLELAGADSGSYSNEADSLEDHPEVAFWGVNFDKLSKIKRQVDPTDLFIVAAGIGSERWDEKGICQV